MWSGDPLKDYMDHESDREEAMASCPKCSECKEYIQDDCYYEFDGDIICEGCLKRNHKVFI